MLAISAHAAAHGGTPDAPLTILLTVLIGWVATALAERAPGALGILTTLGIGQLLMHLVLLLVDDHHGGAVVEFEPLQITCAHALATVLTALLLEHAERGLRTVAMGLRRLLPVLWSPPAVHRPAGSPRVITVAPGVFLEIQLRRVRPRRGPPLHS